MEFTGAAVVTTLAEGIDVDDTVIKLTSAAGWPTGVGGRVFVATLGDPLTGQAEEKVLCSGRSGEDLTIVTRGYDDTPAQAWGTNTRIRHTISGVWAAELSDHVFDTGRHDHAQYLRPVDHAGILHTAAMLGTDSVGNDELADNAVATGNVQDSAITTPKHADGSVTTPKLGDNAATAPKIADDAIVPRHVSDGALNSHTFFDTTALTPIINAAADPGAVGAGKLWLNTNPAKLALLRRNATNTAWEVLQSFVWRPYVPTYPGIPNLGNALHWARYTRTGGTVLINGFFRVGSTTSFAGWNIAVGLPANAPAKDLDSFVGYPATPNAEFFGHSGARASISGNAYAGIGVINLAGVQKELDRMKFISTTGFPAWGQSIPAPWGTTDRFSYFMEYEVGSLEDAEWV